MVLAHYGNHQLRAKIGSKQPYYQYDIEIISILNRVNQLKPFPI